MAKIKRNLTVDSDVAAALDQAGNASAYVSNAVRERWRDWIEALEGLRLAGWTANEIRAACDACNGVRLLGYPPLPLGVSLAAELSDAQRLNDICGKWHIEPRAWSRRVKQIAEREVLPRQLFTTIRECWSGNEAWERALERLDLDEELPRRDA